MKESDIQSAIMSALALHKNVAWAFVTTSGTVKGRGGHWMRLGKPGLPDIIGQLKDGRLFGLEAKQKGEKPRREQLEFIDLINKNNGVAGVVYGIDDALRLIDESTRMNEDTILVLFENWAQTEGLAVKKWTNPAPGHPYCDRATNLAFKSFRAGIVS